MPEVPAGSAQTIVQLYRQLHAEGRPLADSCLIRDAYALATRLFTTRQQASGKSFMAHVVGTASILAALELPGEVVAAGLVHGAYRTGDFGDGARGFSERRRARLRGAVGEDVERYAARFNTLPWNVDAIGEYRERLEQLDAVDQHVLHIRIADALEHLRDGALPLDDARSERYAKLGPVVAMLAAALGHDWVVTEITQALAAIAVEVSFPLPYPRLCTPRSYRRRRLLTLAQKSGLGWLFPT